MGWSNGNFGRRRAYCFRDPDAHDMEPLLLANENTVYLKIAEKFVRRGMPGIEIWHRCNRPTV